MSIPDKESACFFFRKIFARSKSQVSTKNLRFFVFEKFILGQKVVSDEKETEEKFYRKQKKRKRAKNN